MSIQTLSQANAYSQGAELWIVPDSRCSSWTNEIDWYLNFQISKFNARETHFSTQPFENLQTECDFLIRVPPTSDANELLIACERRLPTRYLVVIPFELNLESWLVQSLQKFKELKVNNVRIFLPKSISDAAAQHLLTSSKMSHAIALVLNREGQL